MGLQDAGLPNGSRADVVVDGELIVRIGDGAAAGAAQAIECAGKLVLPAYIDGLLHLAFGTIWSPDQVLAARGSYER